MLCARETELGHMQATSHDSSTMESSLEKLQKRVTWLRSDPENAGLYRQCVDLAMALRQYDVVVEIANRGLERNPNDAALLFDRANAEIGRHHYSAALATLAAITPATDQQRSAISSNQAVCHFCLGAHEQALPLLMNGYRQGQRSPDWLLMLVRSQHFLGQLDEAVDVANENAEAGRQHAGLAGAYALMFLDAEDVAAAAQWSSTALRLDPRSIDGAVTAGTLAIMRLQLDQAQRHFDAVLEIAPETGRAWLGLGTLAMLRQDLDRAIAHFECGLQSMPNYVGGWHMLGWAQLIQQNFEAAQRSLEQALTLDRNFAESHGALAALDAMKGDVESAQRRVAVAQRLNPNSFSSQFATALLEDRSLRTPQAQQRMQRTLQQIAAQTDSALGRLLLPKRKH